jgi:membrane-bound metal-dependent hydrolase YbcI (DUF457 family)
MFFLHLVVKINHEGHKECTRDTKKKVTSLALSSIEPLAVGEDNRTVPQIALLSEAEILYHSLHFSVVVSTLGNFKQHITCSTCTGLAVGGIAYHFGMPPQVGLVSAGLCSFAGMLPDIDSDTSKSFQECIYLTAGIGCILTAARLRYYLNDSDLAMLGGAIVFLLIRFALAPFIKKVTVHRGMIHSIPMAVLCGQLVFFVVTGEVVERLVKAAALSIGFLSHLILDEVYSIDSTGAALRFKKSFGTALKWTNPKKQGSVTIIYSLIVLLGFVACSSPEVIGQLRGNMAAAKQPLREPLLTEIQREATEFLSQQGTTAPAVQPHFISATQPMPEILPSAMQIGNDWNRNLPVQPAQISVP